LKEGGNGKARNRCIHADDGRGRSGDTLHVTLSRPSLALADRHAFCRDAMATFRMEL
jgi:hypothetical protein